MVGLGGSLAVAGESNAGAWRRFEELWATVPELIGFAEPAEPAPTDPWVHVFVRGVLKQKGIQLRIVGEQYETRLAVEHDAGTVIEHSSK